MLMNLSIIFFCFSTEIYNPYTKVKIFIKLTDNVWNSPKYSDPTSDSGFVPNIGLNTIESAALNEVVVVDVVGVVIEFVTKDRVLFTFNITSASLMVHDSRISAVSCKVTFWLSSLINMLLSKNKNSKEHWNMADQISQKSNCNQNLVNLDFFLIIVYIIDSIA